MLDNKIPDVNDPAEYKEYSFNNENFVRLYSCEQFEVRMQYPMMNMDNAESACYVRKSVADRLIRASEILPCSLKLCILDAWRPFKLQEELYFKYKDDIIRKFKLENKTDSERDAVVKRFVSLPNGDRKNPPVHTTGGAVDVTLITTDGKELDMGSRFDVFSENAYTSSFENSTKFKVRDNRRILYNAMINVGFTNLPSEWWHYDFGNRFWAYYNEVPALYDGIFTKEEIVLDDERR